MHGFGDNKIMKKKTSLILLCLCLLVIVPLMSACSLFNIDPDKLAEQLQQQFDYNGQYVIEKCYQNLTELDVSSQQECFYIYEIKDNSTFNVIYQNETLETYEIEGCICGNIEFSDRQDISAKFDENGKMTITRIYADKTMQLVCGRSVIPAASIIGTYAYKSFRRNDATITDVPRNSNYPEENNYFEQSQITFEIGENQTIKTTFGTGETITETFIYTDANFIVTPTQRLKNVGGNLAKITIVDSTLNYTFTYSKS